MKQAPTFPPLLKGYRVAAGKAPAAQARAMVKKGQAGAGDLLWCEDRNDLRFALVLEPETPCDRCMEMLLLVMVAFGDAAGAVIPPEVAITYQWPSRILMNGARVGQAGLLLPDTPEDAIPDWMIVWLDAAIKPTDMRLDPGDTADQTTMWDEGCVEVTRTGLLESTSRHIVNWIHTWDEDGFKPVHDMWTGRLDETRKIADALQNKGDFIGLDENGNALVKSGTETSVIQIHEALAKLSTDERPV